MKFTRLFMVGVGVLVLSGSLSVSFSAIPSAATPPSETSKDRAKWRLTTLSAAREVLDELNNPAPLSPEDRAVLVENLNKAMRENMQAHISRATSQRLCAEIAIGLKRKNLERRFQTVVAHANEQSAIPILWADVVSHLGAGWSNTLEQTMQSFSNTELVPLFKDSRDRAVGLLRQELEQQLRYPSENELNPLLGELLARHPESLHFSKDDDALLQQKLMSLLNPDHKVYFEELTAILNEPTLRISTEIRKQYEQQLALLETATQGMPEDRRQASAIVAVLLTSLEAALAVEQAKPAPTTVGGKPIPVYPLLTPVRHGVPDAAAKLETDRLTGFVNTSPILALDSDLLAKAIRQKPETHHTPAMSEAEFMKSMFPELQEKTTTAYAAGANPSGATVYFRTLLSTQSNLLSVFQTRFTRELHARLPEARQTVSEEQVKKNFAPVERTDVLSTAAFAALQNSGGAALTSLDSVATLFDVSLRGRDVYLEETVDRVLALANRKAREGYEALSAQLALVRKMEQERLDKLRKDVSTRRPYKEIRAEWQSALESAWKADAKSQSTPYKEILELTLDSLNKAVRQLYDSIQATPNTPTEATPPITHPSAEVEQGKVKELRQDPAKPEDQNQEPQNDVIKPPTPKKSPKDGGGEGAANTVLSRTRVDRRNEPDGILLLTGNATGPATARLLNQTGTTICNISFDPGKPKEAASTIFEAIKPQLKTLWTNTYLEWQQEHSGLGILKRRLPPKLKLFVVIESEDVRHRMSLLLRQHIDEALTEWGKSAEKGTPEVELDWKVGLTFDQMAPSP